MSIILAYGDSITYGATDLELGGWANRLRLYLDAKMEEDENLDFRFCNLGIPGETTEGLVKRFKQETEARVRENWDTICIFAYGANDAAFLLTENKFSVDVEKFGENLTKTITDSKNYSAKVFLLTITPVVEKLTNTPEKKKARLNKHIELYNRKIKEIAEINSLPLVDVYAEFMKKGYEKLLSKDGLHPNAEGHKAIFEMVKNALKMI